MDLQMDLFVSFYSMHVQIYNRLPDCHFVGVAGGIYNIFTHSN